MPLATFKIYSPAAFKDYLFNSNFSRGISVIQNHHTWLPSYGLLTEQRGEMYWLNSMRNVHINDRHWSDIGQNITTFPSGNIALCRPIDTTPAGIFGANTGAICIEHFGNFDQGKDAMTPEHKETVILLNAMLCMKFKLQAVKANVVYHHWFDTAGKRFAEELVNSGGVGNKQKTCPGTAFFGGNTIANAEANFFPLISNKINELKGVPVTAAIPKKVNAEVLNVRNGPGKNNAVLRTIARNTLVQVYLERDGWSKISNTAEEWVFSALLV